jgi:type I restriction enzyme S subunit
MSHLDTLITDHLDLWSAAVRPKSSAGRGSNSKLELTGIKKLRELILELAVRGKLVPQDPRDEPASVLLERIAAEKARLVKDGKIKKPKALPQVSEQDKPFELPKGWVITRLGEIGIWATGNGFPTNEQGLEDLEIFFCKVSDMNLDGNERFILKTMNTVSEDTARRIKLNLHKAGTVIFPKIGGAIATNKRRIISKATAIDNNCLGITPYSEVASDYLFLLLTSIDMTKYQVGTSVPALSQGTLELIPIGIPSIDEQHRIVDKVDELMALCDQLELRSESQLAAHQTLVETLLGTLLQPAAAAEGSLTDSGDADELAQNWARLSTHFDTLFTTEASIDALKQTILQLAVMGKLVPQDPSDEPASVLLERIAAEKAQLIKEKKIKKEKNIVDFEGLNDLKKQLPNSWEWIRLADTADLVRGGSPRPAGDPRFYGGNIPFLKVGDITRKKSKFVEGFNSTITEAGLHKTRLIETRTVLLSNSGATLGIPAICTFLATFNDGVAAFVEQSKFIFDEYLYLYLSTISKWFLDIASRGQGQPNLNTDIIKATWFALPPLEEQYRIVAKVDELMALCEQLKSRLQTSQQTQLALAESLVEGALV